MTTETILETIHWIRIRPLMYVKGEDPTTLKVFLRGFILGISINSDVNPGLTSQLFHWLRNKAPLRDISYDCPWDDMITDYYKEKSDEELKELLLKTLEDFFKENPEWNTNPKPFVRD